MQIDETGVPTAKGKDKDDRVIALGLALQGRFELLYGTLTESDDKLSHLPALDKQTWDHVHKQIEKQEEARHGNRVGGIRQRMPRIPRPMRLPAR
jgi:hypothetical protein